MGFEQTLSEYRQAKQELAQASDEEKEQIRAMALQKAWADRICEVDPNLNEEARENLSVETVDTLGIWFRREIMQFPAADGQMSRKQYYLDLFDQNPEQAVQELYDLYRSGLH